MKHPLTSKERRGLVAVAAAALLCIGAGFIFRNCSSGRGAPGVVIVDDTVGDTAVADSVAMDSIAMDSISEKSGKAEKSEKSGDSRKSRKSRKSDKSKKSKSEKIYPSRSPLDEPI